MAAMKLTVFFTVLYVVEIQLVMAQVISGPYGYGYNGYSPTVYETSNNDPLDVILPILLLAVYNRANGGVRPFSTCGIGYDGCCNGGYSYGGGCGGGCGCGCGCGCGGGCGGGCDGKYCSGCCGGCSGGCSGGSSGGCGCGSSCGGCGGGCNNGCGGGCGCC